jgi:predicted neuraminidase
MDQCSLVYRGFPPDLMCVDQYLRVLPDGSWGVFFTTGSAVEPDPGNYIALSRSTDRGASWSPIEPVLKGDGRGVTCTEVFVRGNRITVFTSIHAGCFDKWHNCLIESVDNGKTWSAPRPFEPLPRRTFVRNLVEASWGEWLFPFQTYEIRNNDPEPSPWHDGTFNTPSVGAMITADGGKTWTVSNRVTGVDWAENNIVEVFGERLVMLVRADGRGCLYRSESGDRGRTWSDLVPTDIPNPGSKFRLFKLKDGRIILLHNPTRSHTGACATSNQPNRNPLALWISSDEMRSWGYKRVLFQFPGNLSYPDGFVDADERHVHFAFDYNRHDVIYWGAELP